ncbi:peptidoglycan editing factor PgeF [Acetobacteraceae bacterium ESL0709]|nr:peptidoglycan editing factor PgeF [Acetobacteraceae bacterium ESL0697]MDF7677197.1 peptidoglycan editing factor PgeF [Acetobacteraceae bacterium ESL0709]
MTDKPQFFRASIMGVAHGFFSRHGGVSTGLYAELNGGLMTEDRPENVRKNRQLMAKVFDVPESRFLGVRQIHSRKVILVRESTPLWSAIDSPEADGLVTDCPDVVLTVATADCAPVLLSSDDGKIVGAAHAGWRGAVGGILEETVDMMYSLGARGIRAVIGPCIGPTSYEVSSDMRDQVISHYADGGSFFTSLPQDNQFLFDLPGFCKGCLEGKGVDQIEILPLDTLADQRFYSYRRAMQAGGEATGRQISAIQARPLTI